MCMDAKLHWKGVVYSVQPRIRLLRSTVSCAHSNSGFLLHIEGQIEEASLRFSVAIGNATHEKHRFRIGDQIEGRGTKVQVSDREIADLYKVSGILLRERGPDTYRSGAPFRGVPPPLSVYRSRGHRRLDARTFETDCQTCIWASEMAVELVSSPWNPLLRRHRRETYCYGPKSCPLYKAGPPRDVLGPDGALYPQAEADHDRVSAHRGLNE